MRNFFERINKNLKNNKGFSLVELIIVIAIMAVLIAVLAPQYTKYVERSRLGVDADSAAAIKQALTVAVLDPLNDVTTGTVTATWKTVGSDGSVSSSNAKVQTAIQAVVGTKVAPKSNACTKTGAADTVFTYDASTGKVTCTSTTSPLYDYFKS